MYYAVKPSYLCYFGVTNFKAHFPKRLLLVRKLNEEAAKKECNTVKNTLDGFHLDDAYLYSEDGHGVRWYIETRAAHTQDRKRSSTFTVHFIFFFVAVPLRELRTVRRAAYENHFFSSVKLFSAEFCRRKPPHCQGRVSF